MSTKYSYSKLSTYNSCPQKYKINYINKTRNNCESIEAYMGRRIHEVLEWLHLPQNNLCNQFIVWDRVLEKYNELWIKKWHENIFIAKSKFNKESYNENSIYKIGEQCLNNYYLKFIEDDSKRNVYSVEYKFNVKIGEYTFIGYIDRIDKNDDGSFDIIDYKTGKQTKTRKQASKDLQLAIYYLACRKQIKETDRINLNLYFLRPNDKDPKGKYVRIKHDEIKVDEIKEKIKKNIYSIINENDFLAKESILCEWCYFWKECEVKSSPNPAIRI